MKRYKLQLFYALSGAIFLLSAFSNPFNFKEDLRKQLIGEWRNVYLKIKINTFKTNKSVTMDADSTNWEARLGIKPIRTFFKEDGSYYSEYRNLKDSIIRRPVGTWTINGDTITMVQLKPETSTIKLHVSIEKDKATFTGMIDFDGDGRIDDEYFGIQRKYGR